MRSIGITGASGFLGSSLLAYLHRKGRYHIRALTRSMRAGAERNTDTIEWQQGDLLSRADCLEFVSRVDALVHFAHTNTALTSDRDLPADAMINLIPTLNLLESIKRSGKKPHVVYSSSGGAVYGTNGRQVPFSEDDVCSPISAYGIGKLTAEHYFRLAAREGYLTSAVLRISNPYGVLLPADRTQGFIGVALERIQRQVPVRLFSPKETVRDYLHIDDMCRGVESALASTQPFSVINLGSGSGRSLAEVIAIIEQNVGPFDIDYTAAQDYAHTLPNWNVLDVHKARTELDWAPRINLEEGIAMFCEEMFVNDRYFRHSAGLQRRNALGPRH